MLRELLVTRWSDRREAFVHVYTSTVHPALHDMTDEVSLVA